MSSKISILLKDEKATEYLASCFANVILPGTIIFLEGELGSGKTTFARGFLRGLHYTGSVKSPTYTLVEEYDFPLGKVYHFDLYRLAHPEELDFIGVREYFAPEAVVLVEWPERGKGGVPEPDIVIKFQTVQEGRNVEIEGMTSRGESVLSKLSFDL